MTDCVHYWRPSLRDDPMRKFCIYCNKELKTHGYRIPRLDKKGKPHGR